MLETKTGRPRPPEPITVSKELTASVKTSDGGLGARWLWVAIGFGVMMAGFALMLSVFLVFLGVPLFVVGLALMQSQER